LQAMLMRRQKANIQPEKMCEWLKVSYILLTSKVTHGCPWRDSCHERSEEAGGVTRVGIRCIHLLAIFLQEVEGADQDT